MALCCPLNFETIYAVIVDVSFVTILFSLMTVQSDARRFVCRWKSGIQSETVHRRVADAGPFHKN